MTRAAKDDPPVILVVDDDLAVRMLARRSLNQAGFQVLEAADGLAALELYRRLRPDLILLDVDMPRLDGFQACATLRREPGGEDVPVLMATGLDDVGSVERAYEAGANEFAIKPLNWTILGHRIRYMLRSRRALAELQESEARLANAQRIARLGNWDWDARDERLDISDEVHRIFGLVPGQLDATPQAFLARVHPADQAFVRETLIEALKAGGQYNIEHRIVRPSGEERVVHEQGEVTRVEDGRSVRMSGTIQDITQRKQAEATIRQLAYFDGLTALPNREFFKDRLAQALEAAVRHDRPLAVLVLDLDDFKRINETLGHRLGDRLLREVAHQLAECVRDSDSVARNAVGGASKDVARLGGDEFTVLLTELQSPEDAARVAGRILAALSRPIALDGHEVFITPSIGIAVSPHDGPDGDQLLKNADTAMYHAKAAGKNTYRFYAKSMGARAVERLELERRLRTALDHGELQVHYQPQVDARTREVVGMEALLRWQSPELGPVSPGVFIPLAEQIGLIGAIGEWVLHTACTQNQAWQAAGMRPLRVAVNLSGRQFHQPGLVHAIGRILADTQLDPRNLELEVTEGTIMRNATNTIAALNELKDMGLRLAVDDFGTGYSSLSYLKRFPLDVLKVDRSFVKDIPRDLDDAAIASAIIAMSRQLNLKVIAEGVESEAQLAFLREQGCDEVQGFLFSPAVPPGEFERLVRSCNGHGLAAASTRSPSPELRPRPG